MRFSTPASCAVLALGLWAAPRFSVAQAAGGGPLRLHCHTQFVFQNGAVVQHLGTQLTPLTHSVRLPNGAEIDVRSGIGEFPSGKITFLHEGNYLNTEGGIVFAMPAATT